jgi:hypothetical protein
MAMTPSRPYVAHSPSSSSARPSAPFVLSPPFVHGRVLQSAPAVEEQPEALPSIELFLDRTPLITDLAPDGIAATPAPAQMPEPSQSDWPSWGEAEAEGSGGEEWGTTAWQQFDWSSASNLGAEPPADRAAADAWAETDWSNPRDPVTSAQSAAEALAQALEQISQRIRAGELSVPGTDRVKDDAAIAATLATLLGIKR